MENMAEKGILTVAIGRKFNIQAKYLAYSCVVHSPTLPRAIITDNYSYCNGLYDVIIPYTADMGDPFKVKLKLHNHTPFFETLFLDSDTLVYRDLRFMWDYFGKQSIVYAGICLKEGKWYFKDIDKVIKYYDIPWIGQLNSGIFLFRKDETGMNVLNYATELHEHHREIEVPFFRGTMLPDEPFLAIAFGTYGQYPRNDFGRLGRSLINTKDVKLDITKGIAKYMKGGELIFPSVVHFTGDKRQYYIKEKFKLLIYYKGIPIPGVVGNIYLNFFVCLKFIKRCIKYILRRLQICRHCT
ncbi:hypothetical protein Holit_03344 [Hollandina sp. SP2]